MNETDDHFSSRDQSSSALEPLAVIGVACRLPGAHDANQYWQNLVSGVESVHATSLEEQIALGMPEDEVNDPNFRPVRSILDDPEYFEAAFFGMSAREAQLRDPQHRLFLELAYNAFEDAGYDPSRFGGDIGVYAGAGESGYEWLNIRRSKLGGSLDGVTIAVNSHADYMAPLVSYKLNLRGPSFTVHTACSTSMVAIHLACEAVRNGECDMAVAGGASIDLPFGRGYTYVDDGIYSFDGHCRTFDANATGTIWGSGGGAVVLRRLSDALANGDHIRAVVLGNAINNDGATKVGFTAPSEQGQVAVIRHALGVADIDGRTVTYVEAHGTGTSLGDPIEVAALTTAYGANSTDTGWCAIGSVKPNIGHLGHAAGVAGVIKTTLALENGFIPPIVNFTSPNPAIDFETSPFYVNTALSAWKSNGTPRRAGVSAFGMGGTNGHLVMEEPPMPVRERRPARSAHLVQLSARTDTALAASAKRLADHLAQASEYSTTELDLADVAFTLRAGRRRLGERLAVVARNPEDAAAALADPKRWISGTVGSKPPRVALMFSGQGSQYAGMGAELYQAEPVFRDAVDHCCEVLRPELDLDLRTVMFATGDASAEEQLQNTALTQPALFTIEYALAVLWQSWGVEADAMVGHSIGEYVAATLAGVFELDDALRVVAARGRLMAGMPRGAMLAVQLEEEKLRKRLPQDVSIATVNGPTACVVAGPAEPIAAFAAELAASRIGSRPLRTSHAFHSVMMEPVLAEFRSIVAAVQPRAARVPFLSNLTGDWITPTQAGDPTYWARQLREAVRFGDCLATLLTDDDWLLVECGPGRQLAGLVRLQSTTGNTKALPSLPQRDSRDTDLATISEAAGTLWAAGVELDAETFGAPGYRIPLPTYPWERKRYWVEPDAVSSDPFTLSPQGRSGRQPLERWFAVPAWRQLPPVRPAAPAGRCLVFADAAAGPLVAALADRGAELVTVRRGSAFEISVAGKEYSIRPASREDYSRLVADLVAQGGVPARILHAWTLPEEPGSGAESAWQQQDRGLFSLLFLAQALAEAVAGQEIQLDVLTTGTQDVTGGDLRRPEHATVAGIAKVVPLEMSWLTVQHIDLDPAVDWSSAGSRQIAGVLAELGAPAEPRRAVALRAGRRWVRDYEQLSVPAEQDGLAAATGLRERGSYLITGGLGGIGISLAEDLANRVQARLVLISRTGLPPREEWDTVLARQSAADRTPRAIAAIRRMEAAGAEVLVLAADVADAADLRRVRDEAIARFGELHGIVHAAGVPGGGMVEVKERSTAEAVLQPKILGTLALHEAFGDLALDFVMLCSSMYAITGEFGQVDYTAANTFLDAYAQSEHGWQAPVVSLNWGGWSEVGMAVEVAAPAAFRALQRGERMTPLDHPMLSNSYAGENGAPGWVGGLLTPEQCWVLADHRLAGTPVLPGTTYLECVRGAFEEVLPAPSPHHVVQLRDVVFIEPMAVSFGSSAEMQVLFETALDGLDFQVVSLAGGARRTHAQGSVSWVESEPPAPVDIEEIRRRCSITVREGEDAQIPGSGMIAFGPHWGSLRIVHEGQQEELAFLVATDETAADLDKWGMCPPLLDEATAFGRTSARYPVLPFGYGQVIIRSPLPTRFYSHLQHRDTGNIDVDARDVSLYDESGRELVAISDFTLRHFEAETMTTKLAAQPAAADAQAGMETLAYGATGLGISPADGAEAFRRVLGAGLSGQVAVCVRPIAEVIDSAAAFTEEVISEELDVAAPAQSAERVVDDGFVAPRTELEATVARIWGECLGIAQIGMDDDFFKIGGDSLTAVQLLSMVQKELGVRLPMRSIFESPTIAGAVARLEQLGAGRPKADGQPGSATTPAAGNGASATNAMPIIPRLQREPVPTPAQSASSE